MTAPTPCSNCRCCGCVNRCPEPNCGYECLGGHANYPGRHWCPDHGLWASDS